MPSNDRPLFGKIWRSVRIMRQFNLADLLRTAAIPYDEADIRAARRQLKRLAVHGIIEKIGPEKLHRRAGDFGAWRLTRDTGPVMPVQCELCGKKITAADCEPTRAKRLERAQAEAARKQQQENLDLANVAAAAPLLAGISGGTP